jgi:hypothetical protein
MGLYPYHTNHFFLLIASASMLGCVFCVQWKVSYSWDEPLRSQHLRYCMLVRERMHTLTSSFFFFILQLYWQRMEGCHGCHRSLLHTQNFCWLIEGKF